MRQHNSLFDRVCRYINNVPVGSTFQTSDYTATVGQHENLTAWKRRSKNYNYITYGYRGLLRQAGFVCNPSRGTWQVINHIPQWFDLGHLKFLLNQSWDYKNHCRITVYDGMTRAELLNRLELDKLHGNVKTAVAGSAVPFGGTTVNTITVETDQSLRETYPANIEGSTEFKIAGSVGCTVEKITKDESMFADQPKREVPTQEIVNLGLLRSAISAVDMITTSDSILHGRILNALSILTDIESSMSAKIDAQLFKGKL